MSGGEVGRAPISDGELREIRAGIPAVQRIAYFNAGMLGPVPQAAIDAIEAERAYDVGVRQDPGFWERLPGHQRAARGAVAALTGVGVEQVALMHSTHEGANACLWGLDLRAGDNVVTTDEEHPGLLVPLRHVRDRLGSELRVAAWADADDAFVDGVAALVDARTRAVALSHVSWMTGRVAPLRALRAALPADVRIIVDGAQSAGVLEVDPGDGWDAYTVSGQKWPCGPNGTGGVALADPEAWRPTYGAYAQVTDPGDSLGAPLHADGRRLEMSQEAAVPLAGFAASVDWLVGRVGVGRAHAHARWLNARMRAALTGVAGVDAGALHGDAHLLCADVPAGRAVELASRLYDDGYLVRPLGDARLRVSFGCWNTPAEVDGLAAALAQAEAGPSA